MSNCKCSMAISVNGDGCRYCQPQEYIDKLAEWLEESRADYAALEAEQAKLEAGMPRLMQANYDLRQERDAALAECERLRASLNDAAKAMHWVQANTPMSKRISASLAKARLAAELAALSTNATIPADVTPR